ncbi:DNA-formamidopyrimidine glycosylase family protein [Amycolatopsis sp., V23-08]|uniref:DNA-(apurinic or apyrimidinic site) lyase n=1 Tax=Amycolatopsis heterodermiae TaxID=3110235 RepID=A0ABU5RES7_9PSEU|nr:DNA-formamidopyrimidine glycosylase family protein [Amycolatopsis sp., V23-08]MEA5363681.1 DNA-formamidopyrimidine glycosylase family protein [Amycolatopsis sp., V23-08]
MPEGDTVYLVGKRFERALAGKTLLRGQFRVPQLATVDLAGRDVLGVGTVGKHLFTRFSGDLTLHSHLMMDGMWDVYAAGAKWRRPGHHARVVLTAADVQVIGFRVHDLKLVPTAKEHDLVAHLGPDLLDPQWTEEHAARAAAALAADPARELGLALLDQRVLAGVGNLYKCEICFLLGVTPWTPVSEVDAETTVALSRKLLLANAASGRFDQSTTGHLDRNRKNWVYDRTRQGCFRCGGPTLVRTQGHDVQRRPTWFCPKCQSGPAPAS